MQGRHGTAIRAARPALSALVCAALVVTLTPGLPAGAATPPQPETTWESGEISGIADGDTVFVDITTATDPQFIAPADPSSRSYCDERVAPDGSMPLPDWLRSGIDSILLAVEDNLRALDQGAVVAGILGGFASLIGGLFAWLLLPFFLFYLLKDQPRMAAKRSYMR